MKLRKTTWSFLVPSFLTLVVLCMTVYGSSYFTMFVSKSSVKDTFTNTNVLFEIGNVTQRVKDVLGSHLLIDRYECMYYIYFFYIFLKKIVTMTGLKNFTINFKERFIPSICHMYPIFIPIFKN